MQLEAFKGITQILHNFSGGAQSPPTQPLPIFTIISRSPTCKLICMFKMK